MRIPITCGSCGRDFSAPDTFVGRKVVCPECGQGVKVRNSGIATPKDGGSDDSQPIARRTRGRVSVSGPSPKVLMGIFGVIAAVVVAGMAVNKLPSLADMNSLIATQPVNSAPPPNNSVAQPAEAAAAPVDQPIPGGAIRPPEGELEAQRKAQELVNQPPANIPKPEPKAAPARPAGADRSQATDESDTERGQRLLADVKDIVLVRVGNKNGQSYDPRGTIWKKVSDRSKNAAEKMGLKFSAGSPGRNSAVLQIEMTGKPSPVGAAGTQEVSLAAELICVDPQAKGSRFASVWKHEESVGTIARTALKSGKVPEKMDKGIADFVSRFRVAYQKAAKSAKSSEPDEAMEADGSSDEPSTESDEKSES